MLDRQFQILLAQIALVGDFLDAEPVRQRLFQERAECGASFAFGPSTMAVVMMFVLVPVMTWGP